MIKRSPLKLIDTKIQNRTRLDEGYLKFCFKYLDLHTNPKFSLKHSQSGYLDKLLCRLKDVSGCPLKDLTGPNDNALRCHPIDWRDTTEPAGFPNLHPQLKDAQPRQFQISSNVHGRVHGIFLDDIFFVIWLDPRHKLYR
jgi:hypothetical protein